MLSSSEGFGKVSIKCMSTGLYYRPLLLANIDTYLDNQLTDLGTEQVLDT